MDSLYPWLRDEDISQKIKLAFYKNNLKLVHMYGSKTWPMTRKKESKIQAADMRELRQTLGVMRRDRI